MAYVTEELEKKAKEIIKEHRVFFFTHLIAHLGIASSTFYEHFPSNSSIYKEFELMIEGNKAMVKTSLLSKWYASSNASLQISLMKMIGDDEERKRLSQIYTDISSGGKPVEPMKVDLSLLSKEALHEIRKAMMGQDGSNME